MRPPWTRHTALAGLLALGLAAAAQAAGTVHVRWLEPQAYSDAGRTSMDREQNLANLEALIKPLGAHLPDGQSLTLEVTDVDLAGEIAHLRSREVRVLRGRADWPRMTLRYTLRAGTTVLKTGDAQLADMNYLNGPAASGGHVFEQRMIERWFKAEFAPH
jgi:hypothetical protein